MSPPKNQDDDDGTLSSVRGHLPHTHDLEYQHTNRTQVLQIRSMSDITMENTPFSTASSSSRKKNLAKSLKSQRSLEELLHGHTTGKKSSSNHLKVLTAAMAGGSPLSKSFTPKKQMSWM